MAGDYIPRSDSAFDTWVLNFQAYITANVANLAPLLIGDVNTLQGLVDDWTAAYSAHVAAQTAATGAKNTKDAAKTALIDAARFQIGRLQSSASVDDTERAAMGITVPDTVPTPTGPPTTNPVLQADTSNRLEISISFADEGTPTLKRKPAGVTGCEIWMKVDGAPPTDLDDCEFVTLDTRTPHTIAFDGAEGGKTVHFIGRWVSTRGEKGPISETVSATVPG